MLIDFKIIPRYLEFKQLIMYESEDQFKRIILWYVHALHI